MAQVVIECSHCKQKNRLPVLRLDESPKCGHCHQALASAKPIEIDEATLEDLVRESPLPLLVDFWAPWCGPCRVVAPAVAQVAEESAGRVLCLKVNVDENPGASAHNRVSGIPALVMFKGGREQGRLVGAHPAASIRKLVQQTEVSPESVYGPN